MFRGRATAARPNSRPGGGPGLPSNPWLIGGGLFGASLLLPGAGGGIGGGISSISELVNILPLLIVGGGAIAIVTMLKK